MLSSKEVSTKINGILDEIIDEATQRCKVGKALRADYKTEELKTYIKQVKELQNSFNNGWWIPEESEKK